jgi:hypothetical protein
MTQQQLFDGATYEPEHDKARLTSQLARVRKFMSDERWHTLDEIVAFCGGTTASASARLRDLRKQRFGAFVILRQRVLPQRGLYAYKLLKDARP